MLRTSQRLNLTFYFNSKLSKKIPKKKIFNKEAFAIRISANSSSDIIRLINLYWYSIDSPKFFSGGFRILTEVFPESQKDNSIVLNSQQLYLLLFDTDFIVQRVRPIHNLVSRGKGAIK